MRGWRQHKRLFVSFLRVEKQRLSNPNLLYFNNTTRYASISNYTNSRDYSSEEKLVKKINMPRGEYVQYQIQTLGEGVSSTLQDVQNQLQEIKSLPSIPLSKYAVLLHTCADLYTSDKNKITLSGEESSGFSIFDADIKPSTNTYVPKVYKLLRPPRYHTVETTTSSALLPHANIFATSSDDVAKNLEEVFSLISHLNLSPSQNEFLNYKSLIGSLVTFENNYCDGIALLLFNKMKENSMILDARTYNYGVEIYQRCNDAEKLLDLYYEMKVNKIDISYHTYISLFKTFGAAGKAAALHPVYNQLVEDLNPKNPNNNRAIILDSHFYYNLFGALAKSGETNIASEILEDCLQKFNVNLTVQHFNTLIFSAVLNKSQERAFQFYARMRLFGINGNAKTFKLLFQSCIGNWTIPEAGNYPLDAYYKFKRIRKQEVGNILRLIFNSLTYVFTSYNIPIDEEIGYHVTKLRSKMLKDYDKCFAELVTLKQNRKIKFKSREMYRFIFKLYVFRGLNEKAEDFIQKVFLEKNRFEMDIGIYNELLYGYQTSGHLEDVERIFTSLKYLPGFVSPDRKTLDIVLTCYTSRINLNYYLDPKKQLGLLDDTSVDDQEKEEKKEEFDLLASSSRILERVLDYGDELKWNSAVFSFRVQRKIKTLQKQLKDLKPSISYRSPSSQTETF